MKLAVNTAKLLRNVPLPDEIGTVHDAAVVIDLGSGTVKAGFSGGDAPRYVVPCIEGRPKKGSQQAQRKDLSSTTTGKDMKESYVCSEAYKLRETLDLSWPVQRGLVTDWGDPLANRDRSESALEKIFTHVYEDLLKTSPQDPTQPLLLSEAALTDLTPAKENREKMCELLFESIGVPSLYISQSPSLALFSAGRTTGTVVELGFGMCHTSPVFEGFPLFHSILGLDFGGFDLTSVVVNMLQESGVRFAPCHERFIGDFVKETMCAVAEDRETYDMAVANKDDTVSQVLPDGTQIALGPRRWSVAESLFDPSLLPSFEGDANKGIHMLTFNSIRKCDTDIAPTLFQNVVLAGGTSMLRGVPDRLDAELSELAPNEKVKVYAATERLHATWIGGSILASLPTFQDLWVTRADYDEFGQSHP
eukprot:gene4696-7209_t